MSRKMLAAGAALLALAFAACGFRPSDEEQIRSAYQTFMTEFGKGENGRACAVTVDPGKCIGQLALVKVFFGDGFVRDQVKGQVKDMRITNITLSPDRQRATVRTNKDDDGKPTTFINRNGKWRMELD